VPSVACKCVSQEVGGSSTAYFDHDEGGSIGFGCVPVDIGLVSGDVEAFGV